MFAPVAYFDIGLTAVDFAISIRLAARCVGWALELTA
jgi:hypothetical protein